VHNFCGASRNDPRRIALPPTNEVGVGDVF
jgi:hypothetical protein